MGHGLTATDEMVYVRKEGVPWHGLGVAVDGTMTAEEAISRARLDWQVTMEPLYTTVGSRQVEVPSHLATVRSDTGAVLGVVSRQYQPLQNRDAFKFMDELVATDAAKYHTAGSLLGGKRIWLLAEVPKTIEVVKGDTVKPYILLTNGHDGTLAIRAGTCLVRVVCNNTLNMALGEIEDQFAAYHKGDVLSKIRDAREAIGLVVKSIDRAQETFQVLARTQYTSAKLDAYLDRVFSVRAVPHDAKRLSVWEAEFMTARGRKDTVRQLVEVGAGADIPGVQGTYWGALQAVCDWADHVYRGSDQRRLNSVWFGERAAIKAKAAQAALAMCS